MSNVNARIIFITLLFLTLILLLPIDVKHRKINHYSQRKEKHMKIVWNGTSLALDDLNNKLQGLYIKYRNFNQFKFSYQRKPYNQLSREQLYYSMIKNVRYRVIQSTDNLFNGSKWKGTLPERDIFEILPKHKTCAIVLSSGSLANSRLGKEIDAHDAVIRFNKAMVNGYEEDVGTKSTYRMVNSMFFAASYASLMKVARKGETFIHFDPSDYHDPLVKWAKHPQFHFHHKFLNHVKNHPSNMMYITNPQVLWEQWRFLQDNTNDTIQRIIPSAGFIGISFMLNLCDTIDVYGYLPRHNVDLNLCYYHKPYTFSDICTYGAYHPVLYEKNLIQRMNYGSIDDIITHGKVILRGFRTFVEY